MCNDTCICDGRQMNSLFHHCSDSALTPGLLDVLTRACRTIDGTWLVRSQVLPSFLGIPQVITPPTGPHSEHAGTLPLCSRPFHSDENVSLIMRTHDFYSSLLTFIFITFPWHYHIFISDGKWNYEKLKEGGVYVHIGAGRSGGVKRGADPL